MVWVYANLSKMDPLEKLDLELKVLLEETEEMLLTDILEVVDLLDLKLVVLSIDSAGTRELESKDFDWLSTSIL